MVDSVRQVLAGAGTGIVIQGGLDPDTKNMLIQIVILVATWALSLVKRKEKTQ